MKKLLTLILPVFALLTAAAAPHAASARDWHPTANSAEHSQDEGMRGDRNDDRSTWHERDDNNDRDNDSWRGQGKGWRKHCHTVTTQHWSRWQHRMVFTQERVCRR